MNDVASVTDASNIAKQLMSSVGALTDISIKVFCFRFWRETFIQLQGMNGSNRAQANMRFLLLGSPIAVVGAAAKERNMPFDHSQDKWIPWNKGKLVGQKAPLKPQEVWSIRVRLQLAGKKRDLALFNLAIDSKLRGCDLPRLRVSDLRLGGEIRSRAKLIQQKTGDAVQFEVTKQTRDALEAWIAFKELRPHD